AELARMMETPSEPSAIDSAPALVRPAIAEPTHEPAPALEADLEAQLMSELGLAASPDEEFVGQPPEIIETEAPSMETALDGPEAFDASAPEIAPPATAESLEDELASLLGTGESPVADDLFEPAPATEQAVFDEVITEDVSVEEPFAEELAPPIAYEDVTEIPNFLTTQNAAPQPLTDDFNTTAGVDETQAIDEDADELFADFEAALEADLDIGNLSDAPTSAGEALVPEDLTPPEVAIVPEAVEPSETASTQAFVEPSINDDVLAQLGFDDYAVEAEPDFVPAPMANVSASPEAEIADNLEAESFDVALESEFDALFADEVDLSPDFGAENSPPALPVADFAPEFAPPTVEPQVVEPETIVPEMSPLDELEAIMAADEAPAALPPSSAGSPSVNTADIADPFPGMADFEVPELPDDALPRVEAEHPGFDMDISEVAPAAAVAGIAGASTSSSEAEFEAVFEDMDFEAEFARDLEFARHDDEAALAAVEVEPTPDFEDFPDSEPEEVLTQEKSNRKGFIVAGIIGLVAVAGAFGVFAMNSGGGSSDGPVVVEADPEPTKIKPDDPGGMQVPNQNSVAANGTDNNVTSQEELVTTAEEPIDVAALPAGALPSSVGEKSEDRLEPGALDSGPATADAPTTMTPRRVRTLVVKPDGTLVEQEVAQPEVPAALTTPTVSPDATQPAPVNEVASVSAEPAEPTFTPPAPAANNTEVPRIVATPTQAPVRTVTTQPITAPIVADRPANQPVNVVNPQAQTQVASAPQPAAPPPAATTTASSPFSVQIASVPSREGAQSQVVDLQRRFANVLSGRGVSIQRAEIEGRGTFYRVRVAASSRSDANTLCTQYKRAGGNCFVTR
ncbi:MAG: SPOR domain-containing protein, partial [Pseudomonadota bacterium]